MAAQCAAVTRVGFRGTAKARQVAALRARGRRCWGCREWAIAMVEAEMV